VSLSSFIKRRTFNIRLIGYMLLQFRVFVNATATFKFEKMPLQFCICLIDAITSIYTHIPDYVLHIFSWYIHIYGGPYDNQVYVTSEAAPLFF
jgi:hypothetical protein